MTLRDLSPRELLKLLRDRHPDAAAKLVKRYGGVIRRVIRRFLDRAARPMEDSSAIMQDVWVTFFSKTLDSDTLESPEALQEFLCGLARNKAMQASRFHGAQKRDRHREVPLEEVDDEQEQALRDHELGPSEQAELNEFWEILGDKLDQTERQILWMYRQGRKIKEIASELGVETYLIRDVLWRAVCELEKRSPPG
jgi:RNA polymerase sigma factor (sigma-70 family)